MSSWSRQRRLWYAIVLVATVVVATGLSGFVFFYKAPSCSDGLKNGNETGVDCGGSCKKLCQDTFLPPSVPWTRMKQVAPHLYNVAAYVINPNGKAGGTVPYRIGLFDDQGSPLAEAHGIMAIPPGRNSMVFRGAMNSGSTTPFRAFFEFTEAPTWSLKPDPTGVLTVTNKEYHEGDMGSSLSVTLTNSSAQAVHNVAVYVVLKDTAGTVIDFSKTIVDEVPGLGSADAPFTWPESHNSNAVSIEVLPVAE